MARGLPSTCHPEKPNEGRGLCKECYLHETRLRKLGWFQARQIFEVSQSSLCAICGQTCSTGQRLCVDHDHATGKMRGLLCRKCNSGLGQFGDDPEMLRAALSYLEADRAFL